MKHARIFILVLAMTVSLGLLGAQSKAGKGSLGIGLFLGQPTGVAFEIDLDSSNWLDFVAAWDFASGNNQNYAFILMANYKLAFHGLIVINETVDLVPFVGPGLSVGLQPEAVSIGFRLPFGISWRPATVPIGLYLEIGLGMQLFPATVFQGTGGLGVQYRF